MRRTSCGAQRRRVLLLVAGMALSTAGTTPARAQGHATSREPVTIGAILSVTGPVAGVGQPERDGALLAEKIVNASGGIGGRPLKLVIEDDASNPDTAISKATGLIRSTRVRALIGSSNLPSTVAIGGLTDPVKLPQVALSGMGPAVEARRTCVVHLLAPQELNARAALAYVRDALKVKRIGLLHDSGYGQAVANSLKAVAPDYGVELAQVEKFEIGATDVSTQAAKVKNAGVEAVVIVASSATPFRNVHDLRMGVPVIGSIASSSYDYVRAMGEAAEGVIFPEFLIAEDPLPHQAAFVATFREAYGRLPKNYEAAGWDAVNLLARVLAEAGPEADNAAVCAALRKPLRGVLATYDFSAPDMTGLGLASFSYSQVKNGGFVRLPFPPR
ncbi:ABC transporter substrate-binding protein [Xanthobacter oligotrophicus]|uniref:ABC transporter substrate-binding protein n=1 Tax=Xanthobacter oligotrophicus TaxID=2607286 RepID=A0ABW6ZTC9_9HYPH